ncbi:alpha-L-rhamnosidase N-terminal domain-containing protein [Streptomyces regalis]|uniref:alpha-L-rhamnosidase N-terminal domain-containing protein n=1 Tax=Streptomyces regalis TaxID=68262 RepID=UPI000AB3184E|nr:alpha-L-rhamnosidase N-terminal domain-containing protein [Streptomyces regalis]
MPGRPASSAPAAKNHTCCAARSRRGAPVDDAALEPGWTSYQWRLHLDVAEVTAHIRPGRNALGIILTGGWYTERYGFRDAARRFHEALTLEYEDGSVDTVATDEGWRWSGGPVVSASLYQGETYDAPAGPTRLVGTVVRRVGLRRGRTDRRTGRHPDHDFGQNLVGRVRIRVPGRARAHRDAAARGGAGARRTRYAPAGRRTRPPGTGLSRHPHLPHLAGRPRRRVGIHGPLPPGAG